MSILQFLNPGPRLSRRDYTQFFLIPVTGLFILLGLAQTITGMWFLTSVASLAIAIPGILIGIRRLHDKGRSGWFMLIVLIPIIGGIWLMWSLYTRGTKGGNNFGEDPTETNGRPDGKGWGFVTLVTVIVGFVSGFALAPHLPPPTPADDQVRVIRNSEPESVPYAQQPPASRGYTEADVRSAWASMMADGMVESHEADTFLNVCVSHNAASLGESEAQRQCWGLVENAFGQRGEAPSAEQPSAQTPPTPPSGAPSPVQQQAPAQPAGQASLGNTSIPQNVAATLARDLSTLQQAASGGDRAIMAVAKGYLQTCQKMVEKLDAKFASNSVGPADVDVTVNTCQGFADSVR